MQKRILIMDDDRDMASLVEMHLLDLGFQVAIEPTGSLGIQRVTHEAFDLILLDQHLPGVSGLEICRQLRGQKKGVPILIMTTLVGEGERVRCLEAGADDFVVKPFSILELMARVKAILRRADGAGGAQDTQLIRLQDLEIDLRRHQVVVDGKRVSLTAKEFRLLSCLAKHPGRVFSRSQLVDLVWGHAYDGYDHTVHSHINRLRTKIEPNPAKPMRILTIRNVGYKFHESVLVS